MEQEIEGFAATYELMSRSSTRVSCREHNADLGDLETCIEKRHDKQVKKDWMFSSPQSGMSEWEFSFEQTPNIEAQEDRADHSHANNCCPSSNSVDHAGRAPYGWPAGRSVKSPILSADALSCGAREPGENGSPSEPTPLK